MPAALNYHVVYHGPFGIRRFLSPERTVVPRSVLAADLGARKLMHDMQS